MPSYRTELHIPHTPENLFDLVSDVERYPGFIRWIRRLRIVSGKRDVPNADFVAEADVGFKGFSERFATRVEADGGANTIKVSLVRGPFRQLDNLWRIEPAPGGSRVIFTIDYVFSNPILALLAKANLTRAVNAIIGAFLTEADRRYTREPVAAPSAGKGLEQ